MRTDNHSQPLFTKCDQVLTVAQMRAAEQALIVAGSSVDALMQVAGHGAAAWIWRIAAQRRVTVLCGPGNNGGNGYVIAEALREKGGHVQVIAGAEPKTAAAQQARTLFAGEVLGPDALVEGDILVDCLFGSGLTRALSAAHFALLSQLAARHAIRIAIDLPSGMESDSGAALNEGLPDYHLTLALGAWKQAHFLMPAAAHMGALRLVPIGVEPVPGAAAVIRQPHLCAPVTDSHKYRRGLLGVIPGTMPGATVLAAIAAQHAGAGYVKLLDAGDARLPYDLVGDSASLAEAVQDHRLNALLIGPGLGRHGTSLERLAIALSSEVPLVLDADALMLLTPRLLEEHTALVIATPHEGELAALEQSFGCTGGGSKADRASALAKASGMVIVAKGPDSVIAAPDGRVAFAPRASAWLSTAGTGDVLAGAIASRLATGASAYQAACEGMWLHGEAARLAGPVLTASQLAETLRSAYAACL
ncbi:MAG: hypothetical protein RLZZ136_1246 [Pseudomonadota bacterium]